MPECDYCGDDFDSEKELHIHWGDEHGDEINSHEKDKVKKARREREEEREKKNMKRKRMAIWGSAALVGLAFVIFAGSQIVSSSGISGADFDLEGQPMLGQEDAPVTVVAFEDYQCPYCARFETGVLQNLKRDFIEQGDVKFYFVNYAFLGEDSTEAAVAAECVYDQDEEQYWDFHEAVFENQGAEHSGWVTTESMMDIANQSTEGLDYNGLRQCIENGETQQEVSSDLRMGKKNGISGTPSIFVNGEQVQDWSYPNLKSVIESELAK